MDRSSKPSLNNLYLDNLPKVDWGKFHNDVPFYIIPVNHADLIKITFLFKGGSWVQQHPLQAFLAFNLVKEGTTSKSPQQINQLLDFYGARFSVSVYNEYACISIMCLKKHINRVLDVLSDLLNHPIYDESSFQLALEQRKTNLVVNWGKVKYQADKLLYQNLFGEKHPMGTYLQLEDFDTIDTELLKKYYEQFITHRNTTIIISGEVDDLVLNSITDFFGKDAWGGKLALDDMDKRLNQHTDFVHSFEKNLFTKNMPGNKFQDAVFSGRVIPPLKIEDKAYSMLANTILGGFFGSRLMKNIREDKGYTYGIQSYIVSMKHFNVFSIQTETAKEYVDDVIREVKKEIDVLCNELVKPEELKMVKNYFLGRLARNAEANFSYSGSLARKIVHGIDLSEDLDISRLVMNAEAKNVKNAAQLLLSPDGFIWCVAG